ncbi:MAG: glutamyl-tRNA reductase [Chloroflexi bacterium]|nr:glutamyl-tRNA reductase [Chloroflexota bacterium]
MRIVVVGLNHTTASLAVRERVAVAAGELGEALEALRARVGNGVVLSTCNRSEVYALVASLPRGVDALKGFFSAYHRAARRSLEPHWYVHIHRQAVHHLFRVAAGLDSLILGEAEVLGQVRDAYAAASERGLCGGTMARLFHQALRVGKRARRETAIGRHALSVSRAAVELGRQVLGDVRGKRVLVVGLGDAGVLAARALADAGAGEVAVTNRTFRRAEELARQLGGVAVPFDNLVEALAKADILVSATGSPGYVLDVQTVALARAASQRPLVLVDIAVPRDIDPRVSEVPGVHLYALDDLEALAETNRRQRQQEAERVEVIVGEEVDRFVGWLSSLESVPTVAALRERAESIRARELARLLRRLSLLPDGQRESVEAFSRAMVKKLLHEPIVALKGQRDPARLQVARELFDLDGDRPPGGPPPSKGGSRGTQERPGGERHPLAGRGLGLT